MISGIGTGHPPPFLPVSCCSSEHTRILEVYALLMAMAFTSRSSERGLICPGSGITRWCTSPGRQASGQLSDLSPPTTPMHTPVDQTPALTHPHTPAPLSCGWWSAFRFCRSRWPWRSPLSHRRPGDAPGCCPSSFSTWWSRGGQVLLLIP